MGRRAGRRGGNQPDTLADQDGPGPEHSATRKTASVPARAGGDPLPGPSPNPFTNLVAADIALRGGSRLLRLAVERALLGTKYAPGKAKAVASGRSMTQALVGTALARIATRSVPGAILIGGGLLAKSLYDRRKGVRNARAEGEAQIAKQASKGQAKKSGPT